MHRSSLISRKSQAILFESEIQVPPRRSSTFEEFIDSVVEDMMPTRHLESQNENLLKRFFESLVPIDREEWKYSGLIRKFMMIVNVIVQAFVSTNISKFHLF